MFTRAGILTRFLAASLVPFALVFIFAGFVLSEAIYQYSQRSLAANVAIFTRHASEKITDTLGNIDGLLALTSKNLADAAGDREGEVAVVELLHTLMESNPEIFCAWYVFDGGVLNDAPGWQARSYLQRDGGIHEIPAVTRLDDPRVAPWHFYPYRSGEPYFDLLDYWDYGIGEGHHYTGTLARPIMRDGRVIGTVGIDILYEQALRFMEKWHDEDGYRMLLVSDSGLVVHSPGGEHNGRNILDLDFVKKDRRAIEGALASREPVRFETLSPLYGGGALVQLVPVALIDNDHRLYLYLDLATSVLYRDLRDLMRVLLVLSLLGAAVIVLAITIAARSVVTPIQRLTFFAEAIAGDVPEVTAEDLARAGGTAPEMTVLTGALQKMLGHVEQNHRLTLKAVEAEYEVKKAEEGAKARTQFFATMSHELRTPMNAIVGIADILAGQDMPARQKHYVRDIRSASESLLVIIDDILDVSRLDSGKLKLVPAAFNLWRMLDNVSSLTAYLARDKGLDFTMHRDPSLPEYVVADEVRLRQILVNLLGNAVKFTPAGSVSLFAAAIGGELCFDVTDTGVGIRDEDRRTMFDAFRQVDTTRNRHVKGTGLGLSISLNLAKMMGGSIDVASVYGNGSTFKVRVPLVAGNPTRIYDRKESDQVDIRAGAKVLVVDDNEINLRVARGLMEMFKLDCDTAASGAEALQRVTATRYDLIFMDHMMPEMDGVETTRRIRAMHGPAATAPIVAFTANSVAGVQGMLLEAGMSDFLPKPIRKEALMRVLRRWLPDHTTAAPVVDLAPPPVRPVRQRTTAVTADA